MNRNEYGALSRREQPPEKAASQDVRMRVAGGRTGKVAFRARGLAIAGGLHGVRGSSHEDLQVRLRSLIAG